MAYNNCYHITCSPKYRKGAMTPEIWKRIKELIYNITTKRNEKIYAIGGDTDHIHILVQSTETNKARSSIFGGSSRFLRKEFPELLDINEKSFWSKSNSKEIADENHFRNTIVYINEKQYYK